jgi:hypothetical protein
MTASGPGRKDGLQAEQKDGDSEEEMVVSEGI